MYRKIYLRLSLLLLLLAGCASDYKLLEASQLDNACLDKFTPTEFKTAWYSASVDVSGHHISGLMVFKNMPDSSTRIVFTNEAGVKFFDVGFSSDGKFTVHHAMNQLNKKAVRGILQKDFALILGLPFRSSAWSMESDRVENYYGVRQKKETAYFITPKDCASLRRLEWRSGRKRMMSVEVSGEGYPSPENIHLKHHTFTMEILLKRLPKE
jgi:hypothetical protein